MALAQQRDGHRRVFRHASIARPEPAPRRAAKTALVHCIDGNALPCEKLAGAERAECI